MPVCLCYYCSYPAVFSWVMYSRGINIWDALKTQHTFMSLITIVMFWLLTLAHFLTRRSNRALLYTHLLLSQQNSGILIFL